MAAVQPKTSGSKNREKFPSQFGRPRIKVVESTLQKYPSKKVVLLAHVLHPGHVDDRRIIRRICETVDNARLIPIADEMLPSEARFILGHGHLTVTGRMHAALSTFKMGKPAISLSYSVKYDGIIGKDLGLPELIIEASGDSHWNTGRIPKLVEEKRNYVDNNYSQLVITILDRVSELRQKAMIQIDGIAAALRS